jgi:hypothetical protein
MVEATISRVRMHDLARLGRSRTGHRPASGPPSGACASRRRVVTDARWHRQRLAAAPQSGQLAPRTCDLATSPVLPDVDRQDRRELARDLQPLVTLVR